MDLVLAWLSNKPSTFQNILTTKDKMFAKLLKRKESRQQMVGGGGGQVNQEQQQQQPQQQRQQQQKEAQLQYRYQRPDLLGKVSNILKHSLNCNT